MPRRRSRRSFGFVAFAGVTVLALAVVAVWWRMGNPLDPFDDRRFDAARWRAGQWESRAPMARDALRHLQPGMTESEVVALLGTPGDVRTGWGLRGHPPPAATRTDAHYLGNASYYKGMDDAYLGVHLDESDRVVSAEVYGY